MIEKILHSLHPFVWILERKRKNLHPEIWASSDYRTEYPMETKTSTRLGGSQGILGGSPGKGRKKGGKEEGKGGERKEEGEMSAIMQLGKVFFLIAWSDLFHSRFVCL